MNALLAPGGPGRFVLAAAVIFCLGVVAVAESGAARRTETDRVDAAAEQSVARRAVDEPASRSSQRRSATDKAPQASPVQPTPAAPTPAAPAPAAPAPAAPAPEPPKPVKPSPVLDLTQAQMDNANTIVQVGLRLGMPRKALVIAIATAMQESQLYNLASEVLPESKQYPHEGTGWDHDSVGLFQQRTSTGWGPVGDLMNPEYAATKFYDALRQVPGWEWMELTLAAQAVQGSAFPYAYAQHEWRATVVVNALVP